MDRRYLLSLGLGILLMSCSLPVVGIGSRETPIAGSRAPATQTSFQGQQLPVSALATLPAGEVIQLEVALTPFQQAMGLMHRPALPANRGMLFPFDPPRPVSFWMKNVPVALDMVFLRKGVVQQVAAKVPPCTEEPCPVYGPRVPIDQVMELRAGRAAELGIQSGDRVKIEFLTTKNKPTSEDAL
ncbi:MAG: DUF192 domain-containing protein [Scytolyngbya sp. HA4215-MV1]|jgi:hypothetical protein|nr:DUF192 domain-containing protein [Scytolyngbya sp. HA4215-MV1]